MNKKILFAMLLTELMFVFVYAATRVGTSNPLLKDLYFWFDLDGEGRVPAIFSALQLAAVGGIWFYLAHKSALRLPRGYLVLFGSVFVFLAVDEWAQIHEQVRHFWRILKSGTAPWLYVGVGAWIPVYLLSGAIVAAVSAPFSILLWKRAQGAFKFLVLGGLLFLFGAVLLEISSYRMFRIFTSPLWYAAEVAVEEFFEMAGASLILYGVLKIASHPAHAQNVRAAQG